MTSHALARTGSTRQYGFYVHVRVEDVVTNRSPNDGRQDEVCLQGWLEQYDA